MNGTRCTLEVYNFLRERPVAGHLFVWVGRTKGRAPRTKRPSGRLQRAGTAAECVRAGAKLQRGGEVHRREPKRHTSIRDPLQGSIKSSLHGEATPSLLNVR
ncbi:hypothetical protein PBY51_015267 [Eleginops maclovinus]|uniref:Uncharacterized protein n=1 Tax=Eleginops maclovinus TaxID=56733 RepID=A0AAN7X4J1_ELEMC|nr:hypothetical protein PBY51_015267 [Eleginops maclovinus]